MIWGHLFDRPLFILTSDQDWAPPWAARAMLRRVRDAGVPLHVFRTNPCEVFDTAARNHEITQGWHPNFRPGSSHGDNPDEVIRYMQEHFPGMRTVRSHSFVEQSSIWLALARAGIIVDSQTATFFQGYLMPLLHWSGIVRLPVFFEDDIFFHYFSSDLSLGVLIPDLFTPGLKVLNFHPTHIACNTPNYEHYRQSWRRVSGSSSLRAEGIWQGRGTADVFQELMILIQSEGYGFVSFAAIAEKILNHLCRHNQRFSRTFAAI